MATPLDDAGTMSASDIRGTPAFQEQWYHRIELAPELYTDGRSHKNIHLTRTLLRGCDVAGASCIDIGAMDCLISILLRRRGAAQVMAHDIRSRQSHVDLVKRCLGVDFDYVAGVPMSELRRHAIERGVHPFDLVVFSGVLYHMMDPLGGLVLTRSLLREGGLMVIETSAAVDDQEVAYFNARGRLASGTTYWHLSLECLEYVLRYLRLAPLDCVYFVQHKVRDAARPVCRVAVLCRAVDAPVYEPGDEWMQRQGRLHHDSGFRDWESLRTDRPEMAYQSSCGGLITRETGTLNLYASVQATPETRATSSEEQLDLPLNVTF